MFTTSRTVPACAILVIVSAVLGAPQFDSAQPIPRCPSASQAYEPDLKECYEVGQVGPCGSRSVFDRVKGKAGLGRCRCIAPPHNCARPMSYWPEFRLCFQLFSQGPCRMDEWLVPVKNGSSVCEKHLCHPPDFDEVPLVNEDDIVFTFIYKGICYNTETQAYCGENEVVRFADGLSNPACYNPEAHTCQAAINETGATDSLRRRETNVNDCKPWEIPSSDGKCFPIALSE